MIPCRPLDQKTSLAMLAACSRICLSRLRSVENVEEHQRADACEQVKQRSQKRYRRDDIAEDS